MISFQIFRFYMPLIESYKVRAFLDNIIWDIERFVVYLENSKGYIHQAFKNDIWNDFWFSFWNFVIIWIFFDLLIIFEMR